MIERILELLRWPGGGDLEPAEIAHAMKIYARHPEIGGVLRARGTAYAQVCWAWERIFPVYWTGGEPAKRIRGLSPAQALSVLPVDDELRERILSLDRRIRQDAAASGMAVPDPPLRAVDILVRRERYWIIDVAIEILTGYVRSYRRVFSVPGVSVRYLGNWPRREHLIRAVAAEADLPAETVRDYLNGRLPRTVWEAEVAMSRLGSAL